MVEPLIPHLVTSASVKAVSNVVDDLYAYLKRQTSIRIQKAEIQRKLPVLLDHIKNVRLVKTLWQIDKAVDVESFYYDSHVVLRKKRGKKSYREKINFVSDLSSNDNFVIQGIAGQGKSILLRHLFVNESRIGSHIPIFIELRRIQANETLLTHISRFLHILDLPSDHTIIQTLLKSGKFIFFLDGFDEIPRDQMPSILNELEYLASISQSCQFIVTSRPDSPIRMSTLFNVISLDNLRGNEYQKLIRKLSESKEYADTIIERIEAQQSDVSQLLCTPLLVTLLLVSYKSYPSIPTQLSDFYESIFANLLQRHDGTKPTFTRSRNCHLNDNQYRQVFDAFCFESKKQDSAVFDYQQVYSFVSKAMSLLDINEDPDAYIKDIKNITCLLLEESSQYRFIHNTVQEYYSASFIKSLPDPSAIEFYQACLDMRRAPHWFEELEFLSDIDKYRYTKYFLLPLSSSSMGYEHQVDPPFVHPARISLARTKNILGNFILSFRYHKGKMQCTSLSFATISYFWRYRKEELDPLDDALFLDYTELMDSIASGRIKISLDIQNKQHPTSINTSPHLLDTVQGDPFAPGGPELTISIKQILDAGFFTSEFKSIAQKLSLLAYPPWQQAISYLDKQDAFIETVKFV